MPEGMRWVGLDVHANESACAVFDAGTGEVESRKFSGRPHQLLEWLEGVERPFRAVYEAGPTGYGLARRAAERGIELAVCAPGHIARRPGDRGQDRQTQRAAPGAPAGRGGPRAGDRAARGA